MFTGSTALFVLAMRTVPLGGVAVDAKLAEPRDLGALFDAKEDTTAHIRRVLAGHIDDDGAQAVDRMARTIVGVAESRRIDPYLVLAVIRAESTFQTTGRSHAGALGLMQIMPSTGRAFSRRLGLSWKGPSTLLDPTANITIGVAYFSWLLDRFDDDVVHALTAYCHGPARVRKLLRDGSALPEDRLAYSRKVLGLWLAYLRAAERSPGLS